MQVLETDQEAEWTRWKWVDEAEGAGDDGRAGREVGRCFVMAARRWIKMTRCCGYGQPLFNYDGTVL